MYLCIYRYRSVSFQFGPVKYGSDRSKPFSPAAAFTFRATATDMATATTLSTVKPWGVAVARRANLVMLDGRGTKAWRQWRPLWRTNAKQIVKYCKRFELGHLLFTVPNNRGWTVMKRRCSSLAGTGTGLT